MQRNLCIYSFSSTVLSMLVSPSPWPASPCPLLLALHPSLGAPFAATDSSPKNHHHAALQFHTFHQRHLDFPHSSSSKPYHAGPVATPSFKEKVLDRPKHRIHNLFPSANLNKSITQPTCEPNWGFFKNLP